jgi:formate/nitrite transporter FocA (FNT family)
MLCIPAFILCSYEHCVANMLYFTVAGAWSTKTIGYLVVMTLGNGVGGVILPLCKKIKIAAEATPSMAGKK